MKLIIAGSRKGFSYSEIEAEVKKLPFTPNVIVSGTAYGVDRFGERYAEKHGIRVQQFPAQWRVNGEYIRTAGFSRNVKMAEYADALIAFRYNNSKGTTHMINIARKMGLTVYVVDKNDGNS